MPPPGPPSAHPTHRDATVVDDRLAAPAARQQIRFAHSADGVRLAYAIEGHGPLLLKAATWLSHLEYDHDSPVWRHLLQAMSAHATFVRYDERGCGLSDRELPAQDFAHWVSDLETLVEALGATRFALLGISQGASIAIAYAARHPEQVTHLVLHGGYARGRLVRSAAPAEREVAAMMQRLIEIGWGREEPSFRQFFTSQFIPGGTPEQHSWFNELQHISCTPAMAARFVQVFDTIDVREQLAQVRCPTLVLHSTGDVRVPFAEGRLIASAIADARFVPLESRNHLLLAQEPAWARWLAEVRAFLPQPAPARDPLFDTLTARERELLELLAQGRDNAQIAASLGLSDKTVRNHLTHVFAKLGVDHRGRAIVLAREAGFGRRAG